MKSKKQKKSTLDEDYIFLFLVFLDPSRCLSLSLFLSVCGF
jgi:hypothetical protein